MTIAENVDIETWISKETPEPVLEPALPIIDPHHHLWDLRQNNSMGFRQEVYLCAVSYTHLTLPTNREV